MNALSKASPVLPDIPANARTRERMGGSSSPSRVRVFAGTSGGGGRGSFFGGRWRGGPVPAPRARLLAVALVALLVGVPLAGCVQLTPARVPDRLLEGRGGNGWEKNLAESQSEPESAQAGTFKSQSLVYEDRQSEEGYQGSLTVTTIRRLLRPTEDAVRDVVQERIREEAEAKGLKVEGAPATGTRALGNRAESFWFVYNGSAETSGFFSRNARVKIYGEVFQCVETKSIVVAVGLAQVTDVRSVGGVPLPSEADPTTWHEIVADPRGSIEGVRGSDGLAYNVQC